LNTDPHAGDFIIDPKTRTIRPIDFGQSETFQRVRGAYQRDELLSLAELLSAYRARDASGLARAAQGLSDQKPSAAALAQLKARLKQYFSDGQALSESFEQRRLLEVLDLLANHDLKLRSKFSVGVLKSLSTLVQENYVTGDELAGMLREQVVASLRRKPLAAARSIAATAGACVRESLKGALRGVRRSLRQ
jgi:predicted unusual protein kinase regulating ubiquinone biosynthesis (AarF/ABC1/UbiB family)